MIGNLNLAEAYAVLIPLITFIAGIVIYSIFIFNFYRFLSRKNIFELNLEKHNTSKYSLIKKGMSSIIYFFKYILLFPIFTFIWFAVFTILLLLLAKNQPVENIMMVSISVVSSIRITAYYTEDLSRDLAKMLPFALLGIFLIDVSYFSISNSIKVFLEISSLWRTFVYYMLFVIILEYVLKVTHPVVSRLLPGNNKD